MLKGQKTTALIRNQTTTQTTTSFDHNFAISSQQSRKTPEEAIFRPSDLTSKILIQAEENPQSVNATLDFPLHCECLQSSLFSSEGKKI